MGLRYLNPISKISFLRFYRSLYLFYSLDCTNLANAWQMNDESFQIGSKTLFHILVKLSFSLESSFSRASALFANGIRFYVIIFT